MTAAEEQKEKRKVYDKRYYEANKEKCKAYFKAYDEANKEKRQAYRKAYQEANKEKIKQYREANKDKKKAYLKANKERRKDLSLQSEYGISLVDYNRMADAQGFTCVICRDVVEDPKATWKGKAKTLHVDHDHTTEHVRGLLCEECNKGLGLFHDSPTRLRAAAHYLEHHRAVVSVCEWMQAVGAS